MAVPEWRSLPELASARVGGEVVYATDEWFSPAPRLLAPEPPVWREGVYTPFGKWMDGWETRRRRAPGHDWCVLKLGLAGVVHGVEVDTAYFTGNYVPRISVQAAVLPDGDVFTGLPTPGQDGRTCSAAEEAAAAAAVSRYEWKEIVPMSGLGPGLPDTRITFLPATAAVKATHLRVNYFPDGGVARLRVYGDVAPASISRGDFACLRNGGAALVWSDAHYGSPSNLLLPRPAAGMAEGWETARQSCRPAILQRGPDGWVDFDGSAHAVIRLGGRVEVEEVEVDTSHFKGNCPESVTVERADNPALRDAAPLAQRAAASQLQWSRLVPRSRLSPDAHHVFRVQGLATHVRITIFPDGGVARLRVRGSLAAAPRM